jgi:hypothetical protein
MRGIRPLLLVVRSESELVGGGHDPSSRNAEAAAGGFGATATLLDGRRNDLYAGARVVDKR